MSVKTANGKVGLIAGSGSLPHEFITGARENGYDVFVIALKGFTDKETFDAPTAKFGFGEIGGLLKCLKREQCTHVSLAGKVSRPDFSAIKPDFKGMSLLPKVIKAAAQGDDALLTFLMSVFEKEGYKILAPQDVCGGSLMCVGVLGEVWPQPEHEADIAKAMQIARLIGTADIGQGTVVHNGLVLAVEAQEGTDKMLERVAQLPDEIRGGVLAKCLKPGQDERADLPTIGITTVTNAHKAGLAGIAIVAGGAFVMNKDEVIKAANTKNIFIYGVEFAPKMDR